MSEFHLQQQIELTISAIMVHLSPSPSISLQSRGATFRLPVVSLWFCNSRQNRLKIEFGQSPWFRRARERKTSKTLGTVSSMCWRSILHESTFPLVIGRSINFNTTGDLLLSHLWTAGNSFWKWKLLHRLVNISQQKKKLEKTKLSFAPGSLDVGMDFELKGHGFFL